MAICPKCSSEKCVKDGIVKGKQRYRCKSCDFRHTVQHRGKSPDVKRQALELYLEGLGFRSIGRFLKCSHQSIFAVIFLGLIWPIASLCLNCYVCCKKFLKILLPTDVMIDSG